MTTAEYLATPETVLPAELAYGIYHVRDSPVIRHQRVVQDGRVVARALFEQADYVHSTIFEGLTLRPADVLGWW